MGILASESVAANFEQRMQIAVLESQYREAADIVAEASMRAHPASQILASPPFQQQGVPAK
jgi:hypothetical protein